MFEPDMRKDLDEKRKVVVRCSRRRGGMGRKERKAADPVGVR
jgi:hypothetical protein